MFPDEASWSVERWNSNVILLQEMSTHKFIRMMMMLHCQIEFHPTSSVCNVIERNMIRQATKILYSQNTHKRPFSSYLIWISSHVQYVCNEWGVFVYKKTKGSFKSAADFWLLAVIESVAAARSSSATDLLQTLLVDTVTVSSPSRWSCGLSSALPLLLCASTLLLWWGFLFVCLFVCFIFF